MAKIIHDYSKAKYNTVRFDRLGLENCEILDPRCVDLFPTKKTRIHSHEYLEVFYVLKGTGYIHITKTKKTITLREGTMLYIDPKVEHITYVNDKISEATCLNFFVNKLRIAGCKPNSLSTALSSCNDDGYYAIDLNKESILNIVNMINYEHEKQLSGCAYKIGHLFKFLVIDIQLRIHL